MRRPRNHMLKQALNYRASKKKIGRPCYTWNTSMKQDFLRSGIQKRIWKENCYDREQIKKMNDSYLEGSDDNSSKSGSESSCDSEP